MQNDPIFVRSAGKLQPTSYAEQLLSRLPGIVDDIDSAIYATQQFDPTDLKGRIQICINRPIQSHFGADLFARLSKEAPNATWYIKSWESTAIEQILDGRVLMGVNYYNDQLPKSIAQRVIASDEFVLLSSNKHPLAGLESIKLESVANFGFISLTLPSWDEKNTHLNRVFNHINCQPDIRLQTDSLTLAMQVARSSNLLLPASSNMNFSYSGLIPLSLDFQDIQLPRADVVSIVAQKNKKKPVVNWLNTLIDQMVKEKL